MPKMQVVVGVAGERVRLAPGRRRSLSPALLDSAARVEVEATRAPPRRSASSAPAVASSAVPRSTCASAELDLGDDRLAEGDDHVRAAPLGEVLGREGAARRRRRNAAQCEVVRRSRKTRDGRLRPTWSRNAAAIRNAGTVNGRRADPPDGLPGPAATPCAWVANRMMRAQDLHKRGKPRPRVAPRRRTCRGSATAGDQIAYHRLRVPRGAQLLRLPVDDLVGQRRARRRGRRDRGLVRAPVLRHPPSAGASANGCRHLGQREDEDQVEGQAGVARPVLPRPASASFKVDGYVVAKPGLEDPRLASSAASHPAVLGRGARGISCVEQAPWSAAGADAADGAGRRPRASAFDGPPLSRSRPLRMYRSAWRRGPCRGEARLARNRRGGATF